MRKHTKPAKAGMAKSESKIQLELERIRARNGGLLSPEQVVEAARAKRSPLHKSFTWDDTEAAHQYRLEEARRLIRVYVTILVPGKNAEPTRAYVSLTTERGSRGGYRATVDVLKDSDLRTQLLRDALVELTGFQRKYSVLTELAGVFSAINKVRKNTERVLVNA